MKHALAVLAGACLAACTTTAPSETSAIPAGDKDTCGAARYANLIGKPVIDPAVPAASRDIRHIRPNSVVTMDFSPQRLNIDVNDQGVITGLRCF
jgi:Peptidase inhibitor I78 family